MGTVYSVADAEKEAGARSLRDRMRQEIDPRTGRRVWSPLVAISLLVYFVLAMQCTSTIAVHVARPTPPTGHPPGSARPFDTLCN